MEIDGVPAGGPSYRKGRGLLAYLALENGWHTREKLGELFTARSAGYLRQLVSNLRSSLEQAGHATALIAERNLLRLNPHYSLWLDTEVFLSAANERAVPHDSGYESAIARMEHGAALYQGEFLDGLSLPDSPEFEEWLEVRRQHMLQQALALLDRLRHHSETAGQLDRALMHARRILALDAWNESAHRHVMRLLALSGRTAAALAHYETCRWTLERELGLTPEPETQHLHALIQSGSLAALTAPAHELPVKAIAERRLVTILCCELEVPGEEDVDAIADALAQPRLRCQAMLASGSGHRVMSHGNRLLAYFGLPLARENAALAAVHTALSICRQIEGSVAARIGIHTGIVITHAQSDEPDAAGIASGHAIRLTEKALPGQVVVSEPTQHLVRGYFHLQSQGSLGRADTEKSMAVFRIEGETGADNRLDSAISLSPLVGREAELATLLGLWQEARQGHRSNLLIRGDAGIGKSRLVRSLRDQLADESLAIFELRCLPEFSSTPFHPLLALFTTLAGFVEADTLEQKRDKMADALRTFPTMHNAVPVREALSLLTDVLHLGEGDAGCELTLTPLKQREKTFQLLLALLETLGNGKPALLIVEDLHWCDPSTLDVLASHVLQPTAAPMLTLLTSRPDCEWQHARATLDLPPLSNAQAMDLVRRLEADLPSKTIEQIVAWSDGIPLYVEEMARMNAQAEAHAQAPHASLTLQELLAARLDSKGPDAKATAQLAATLGRDFSLNLLQWLSPLKGPSLQHALNALQHAGLILATGNGTYQFKHALIQDAAYQSLTRNGRVANHKRIAQGLRAGFSALVENQPEILAQHLALAGEAAEAIELWLKAGRWAARRSADREAAHHFEAGLALLPQLRSERERARLELALQVGLGSVYVAMQGYGSQEAKQVFTRAVALIRDVEDDATTFPVIFGLWQGGITDRVTSAPVELAERLERIARASGDPFHQVIADYAYGNNLFWLGRHDDAARHLERAIAAPSSVQGEQLVAWYGEDCRNFSRCFLAWTLCFRGRPDEARRQMGQAVADARQLGHAHSLAFALTFAAQLQRHIGDADEAELLLLESVQLANEHGMALWSAVATGTLGWARAVRGDEQALDDIRGSIQAAMIAMPLVVVTFRSFLTDALLRLGHFTEALACIEETIARAEAYEDLHMLPEFLRQQAACIMALDTAREDDAKALLVRALKLAQQQNALILELRVAADLALLPCERNDVSLELLQRVYDRCREGFDTPDVMRVAGLLKVLKGGNAKSAANTEADRGLRDKVA
ncbi:AAA family ATPase [Dyella subtropica]|uniref:AAA family ATPase n=1 Tax=Dyella subtropica TaxID=2992127 RepID=UPI002259857F|nr:AAA family ATPase [Dyella subtropica]